MLLDGLRVAVDVQHIYRAGDRAGDWGATYALANGTHASEAAAALLYAAGIRAWLRARGATVLTNDPLHGILVGSYPQRNRAADAWRADLYLACHVNAGRGGYTLAEYRSEVKASAPIGRVITHKIRGAFAQSITAERVMPLAAGQRGYVCIGQCLCPALILEPFFGDNPKHQGMLLPTELVRLGQAIGAGVTDWWLTR